MKLEQIKQFNLKNCLQATTLSLVMCTAAVAGPQDALQTINVGGSIKSYLSKHDDGWFAYSIPAAADTPSMCCYNKGKQSVCDLGKKQYGYGSSSSSPNTDNIHVFVNLDEGKVKEIMPVGDHCEVHADGIKIDWLTAVSDQQSIQWLSSEAKVGNSKHHNGSMHVLSLHAGESAASALYDLASDNVQDYSEPAVFWLGQRRQDGFDYLQSLIEDLPPGEVRRKINFALSQHHSSESVDLLKTIAQHDEDDEQQADAIFWLSQTDDVADLPEFLIDLMSTSDSHEVKEKAIFSLSQINNDDSNIELMKLVKNHKDEKKKKKALFWLAQNSPKRAKIAAIELLKSDQQGNNRHDELENAVFVLSQLPSADSSAALFEIVKGDYDRSIKKKALFWLSQSDDEDTIKKLEDIL